MMASDDDVTLRAQLTLVPHWLAPASVLASVGARPGPGGLTSPGQAPEADTGHWRGGSLAGVTGGRHQSLSQSHHHHICHVTRAQSTDPVTGHTQVVNISPRGHDHHDRHLEWRGPHAMTKDLTLSLWWRSPDTHLSSLCHNPTLGCQQEQTRKRFSPTLADWIIPCLQLLQGSEVWCAPLKLTSCRKASSVITLKTQRTKWLSLPPLKYYRWRPDHFDRLLWR